MKRDVATDRIHELLENLEKGGRHAQMVKEVWVFGSYARGALEPGDIDLEIIFEPDEQYKKDMVGVAPGWNRDPQIALLQELRGRRQCFQAFANYEVLLESPDHTLIYQRGDTLEQAKERVSKIQPDPSAGRAERDPAIRVLDGLEKRLARADRTQFSAMVTSNWIQIERLELDDPDPSVPAARGLKYRYKEGSPYLRSCHAVVHELENRGVKTREIIVGRGSLFTRDDPGKRPTEDELTHQIGWKFPVVDRAIRFLGYEECVRYIYLPNPTKKGPVTALFISRGDGATHTQLEEYLKLRSAKEKLDALPELKNWIPEAGLTESAQF